MPNSDRTIRRGSFNFICLTDNGVQREFKQRGKQTSQNDPYEKKLHRATNSFLTWFLPQPNEGVYPEVTDFDTSGFWELVRSQNSILIQILNKYSFTFSSFLLFELLHVIF